MAEDAEAEQSREEKEGVEFKITRVEGRRKFVSPAAIFRIMPVAAANFSITMSLSPPLPLNSLLPGSSCVHLPRDNFPDANSLPRQAWIALSSSTVDGNSIDTPHFIARSLAYTSIGKFNLQGESESVADFNFNFDAVKFK